MSGRRSAHVGKIEPPVAAGVIEVTVRVGHPVDRLVRERLHEGSYVPRAEPCVDDQTPLVADDQIALCSHPPRSATCCSHERLRLHRQCSVADCVKRVSGTHLTLASRRLTYARS